MPSKEAGRVIKRLQPGSYRWLKRYGDRLVCVRYRGNPKRRVRSTTVEIIVEEAFWNPVGYENYKKAMSSIGQSVE
jgi:hypothetical protein